MSQILGQGLEKNKLSPGRIEGLVESPLISASIRISTVATLDAVNIPPGVIVTKVGMWCYGSAFSSATLEVGVSGVIDKFFGKVSDMTANDVIFSGLGGTVAADPVGGAYFASGGTIQVGVTATDEGTVKILVWYTATA